MKTCKKTFCFATTENDSSFLCFYGYLTVMLLLNSFDLFVT